MLRKPEEDLSSVDFAELTLNIQTPFKHSKPDFQNFCHILQFWEMFR